MDDGAFLLAEGRGKKEEDHAGRNISLGLECLDNLPITRSSPACSSLQSKYNRNKVTC